MFDVPICPPEARHDPAMKLRLASGELVRNQVSLTLGSGQLAFRF